MVPWEGCPKAACLAVLVLAGVLGCALEQGSNEPAAGPSDPQAQGAWTLNEEWLDSCRRWCGVDAVLRRGCRKGTAVMRGVLLGQPLPVSAAKSYDVACIDTCINFRGPDTRCWRQQAELNECLASEAIFVCDEHQDWDVYGCFGVGSDPTVCDAP